MSQSDPASTPAASLEQQIVELSALAGGLAHEIRNPLSTLKVNLQLLDEDWSHIEREQAGPIHDVARRSRKRVGALLAESARLERILQDFIEFIGKRSLRRSPYDLNVIVSDLAEFFRPQAAAHRIELVVESASRPILAQVDAQVLKQAILNLLINAQEAMSGGGRIVLRVSPEAGGWARIDVEDTGPGVPQDVRDQVFRAYFSTKKGGTGLGLATARQIITEHGGRMELDSGPPGGARFSILLPTLP